MYFHVKDKKWFDNRKQAKDHYGTAYFRRLLNKRDIIFTNTNYIANDELYSNTQVDSDISDRKQ